MSSIGRRLAAISDASPREAVRLVYRKAIYRKVILGQLGVPAGQSRRPENEHGLDIEFLGPDRYDEVLGANPFLTDADLAAFHRQDSKCIVARDGDRIAGSSWMTRGEVYVQELHRTITIPDDQHFSCRSHVSSDYGGRAIMSHMIHAYSANCPPDDYVWGLVYSSNVASVRSLEKIGWQHTGDYWTSFVFGRKVPGERHFPARPAADHATP